jgi:hypothetical protein
VKFDWFEGFVEVGRANVDGGLLVTLRAGLVSGVELAPDEGAGFAFVAPWGGGGLSGCWRGGQRGDGERKSGKCRKTHMDISTEMDG